MADTSTIVQEVLRQYENCVSTRSVWHQIWKDIKDLVRPTAQDFFNTVSQAGQVQTERIYDGTAPWSLEQLASGLNSFLTSPIERWFNLGFAGIDFASLDPNQRRWLEAVSDLIYNAYSNPEAGFNSAINEVYLDLCGFGTAVMNQEYAFEDGGHLVFKACPLADCHIAEDSDGRVNKIYRLVNMTSAQMIERFGTVPEKIAENKDEKKEFKVLHAVYPRSDRVLYGVKNINMPFVSAWISVEEKFLLHHSGFMEFPYHVPRWTKTAGEMYGRSPAMTCLPDIKMLNQMSKVVIKAAQKVVDPPLMVPDDGFVLPIKTAPSSLLFYTAGTEDRIEPLQTNGRVDVGLDMMEQRRTQIMKAFYIDWLLMQKNNQEMTATEVVDRRQEKFRMMAPMIGRIQGELLGPMIRRSYMLLLRAGRIPQPPRTARNKPFKLNYVSPAALAQYGTKLQDLNRFSTVLTPVAQIKPEVLDIIDTDALATELSVLTNVSPKILRTPEQVAGIRQQRAQQQQAALQTEMAKGQSEVINNLADAKQKGGMI